MPRAATATPRRRATARPQVPFVHKLALDQWLLSLFNVQRFEQLAEHLRNEKLEGMDENNVHHFHHALTAQLFNLTQLPSPHRSVTTRNARVAAHPFRGKRWRAAGRPSPMLARSYRWRTGTGQMKVARISVGKMRRKIDAACTWSRARRFQLL